MSMLEGFEENLKSICEQYTKNEDKYDIILAAENYPQFQNLLKRNAMTFIVRHSETYTEKKRRLLWKSCRIPFFKTPFCIEKVSAMQCSNGPKYYSDKQAKRMAASVLQHSNSMDETNSKPAASKRRNKPSKKVGCNATMKIVIVKAFPEYCIKGVKSLKEEKALVMKDLKKKLEDDAASVVTETIYHVSFSTVSAHCHSIWTSFTGQQLDPALRAEIRTLVESGITNDQTIKVLLCKWVKENIGEVSISSRAYWPTKKIIHNYVLKYAPHVKTQRGKAETPAPKVKNKNRKKKQRIEKPSDYQSFDSSSECYSPIEICLSSPDIPVFNCNEHDYQFQITCSSPETFDPVEKSVSNSEIRGLVRTIYDRSLLLPDHCTDLVLRDKLLDVLHLMNNYIDNDQSIPSS